MQRFHRPADTSAARPRTAGAPRTRAAVAAAALLVICGAPFAGAATGDNLREGVRNGTTSSETEIIANIRTTTAAKGGFAMRMSNLSSTGGGFINGCRASAAATSKPCYRASNLSTGRAFEFNSNNGAVVGTISAGTGGDAKKPFTTNATGVATGLNADRVDNLHASEIIAAARAKTGLAAATADKAALADKAERADKATDSDTLDGLDSAAFVQKADRVLAFATITSTGTVIASKSHNITAANIDPDTQTGIVCFTDLPFTPRNAIVSAQGIFDGGQSDVIATSFTTSGTVISGDCSGKVQVRTFDVSDGNLADRAFHIWFAE